MTQTLKAQTPKDSRVGVLCRNGAYFYYAYVNEQYVESCDLSAVELHLSIFNR